MKKQTKQQPVIDLDTFEDVSLYQMIPSGAGMGQAMLKVFIDSVHNGSGKLNSLLITGKEGLATHASAFHMALGVESINQIDASMFNAPHDIYIFFCAQGYQGYTVTNVENISTPAQYYLCQILKEQRFSPYNYMEKMHDIYDVPGLVIMTANNREDVPKSVIGCINYVVEIENYTPEQLELIILQRLKYAHIEYEDEYILQEVVKYGDNELDKSIRFLRVCIAVMQSDYGRQVLLKEDVIKAGRLNRLPNVDGDTPY
jgi:hypothetical protein